MSIDESILLQILFQNKGKMTSDQIVCVVLLSGLLGVLIFRRVDIIPFLPGSCIIVLSLIVVLWGTCFITERHNAYRNLQQSVVDITTKNTSVPDGWHKVPGYFGKTFFVGYGAYCIFLWGLFVAVVIVYD